jgi:hypothetical protein
MFKQSSRNLALALTLTIAAAPACKALAQSTNRPPDSSTPSVVTGTNPEPDYVGIVLAILGLA